MPAVVKKKKKETLTQLVVERMKPDFLHHDPIVHQPSCDWKRACRVATILCFVSNIHVAIFFGHRT